jgi:cysteinyl-tRNA synthetase, unknown class
MLGEKRLFIPLVATVMAFALFWPYRHLPAAWMAGYVDAGPLAAARSWHYQLDSIDAGRLAATPGDVLVIDYAKIQGKVPLSPEEVARIKAGPDGKGRIVLAYLSVGESEEYRFYWQPEWKTAPPAWLGEENCAWPQAHRVRFWEQGWKDINFAGPNSYLSRILAAGFDGIYLDRVDIYETYEKERKTARADMIAFIEELAATAWRLKPGFFIVPQNAEALLDDPRYRAAIDAVAKESLFHGLEATAARNKPHDIAWSSGLLHKLRREGKPVFVVEYLLTREHISLSEREIRAHGFLPTFQTRALDGKDPTLPVELTSEVGTPERTNKACPPGSSW